MRSAVIVQFCGHLLVSRNLAGWLAGLLGLLQCSMWSVELLLLLLVLHPGRIGGTNSGETERNCPLEPAAAYLRCSVVDTTK